MRRARGARDLRGQPAGLSISARAKVTHTRTQERPAVATNVDLFFYDGAPTNTISGATINNVGATDWVSSVELPIGDYMIWVRFGAEFSSTGYLGFAVYDSGNVVKSTYAMIGANTTAYHFPPSVLQARVVLTATTTLKIRGFHSSGVDSVANQGNTPAEYSQWTIVKI